MAGLKVCTKCSEHLLPDQFYKGRLACKACQRNASRAWRQANPEAVRAQADLYKGKYAGTKTNGYRLKYRYGISLEHHKEMADSQQGKCAICVVPFERTPHVDHCHATGVVRGLLCDRCNRGIGYFADSPERLQAASDYLKRVSK